MDLLNSSGGGDGNGGDDGEEALLVRGIQAKSASLMMTCGMAKIGLKRQKDLEELADRQAILLMSEARTVEIARWRREKRAEDEEKVRMSIERIVEMVDEFYLLHKQG